jgi:hypothetical protein
MTSHLNVKYALPQTIFLAKENFDSSRVFLCLKYSYTLMQKPKLLILDLIGNVKVLR